VEGGRVLLCGGVERREEKVDIGGETFFVVAIRLD
jgi:hypothetical protein